MLVLSRKRGQTLVLGNGVRVCVVEIKGGVVRLGIDAPRDFPVVREELMGGPEQPWQHRRNGSWPELPEAS